MVGIFGFGLTGVISAGADALGSEGLLWGSQPVRPACGWVEGDTDSAGSLVLSTSSSWGM